MDINEMTRKEFESLPRRSWDEDIGKFDSIVIIPAEIKWYSLLKYEIIEWIKSTFTWVDSWYIPYGLHDSGYRCMDFVACKRGKPICLLSGCSDVINLNGPGGSGKDWIHRYSGIPDVVPRIDWSIDCLKESGFLRLFVNNAQLEAGHAISSFDLFAEPIKQELSD